MLSDDSSSSEFEECILKCEDSEQLYSFPTKTVLRNAWFCKLGLEDDDFYPRPRVCNRHFSDKMVNANKTLKPIAVPDINLPNAAKNEQTIVPYRPPPNKNKRNKKIKIIQFRTESPNTNPALNVSDYTEPIVNAILEKNWINDDSSILVDYQLKFGGNHLFNVIEIPQYIVVFTVLKAERNKLIQLPNIQNKPAIPAPAKRTGTKKLRKSVAFNTVDEGIDNTPSQAETVPTLDIQPMSSEKIQTRIHQDVTTVRPKPKKNELEEPEKPAVISLKPKTIIQPQIDIVYYTNDDAPPRRDRSTQVNFSKKHAETAIQCDVQLENDLREMSYNAKFSSVQSRFKTINLEKTNMEECLVCGEIVTNNASRERHALEHKDEAITSMCCKCGEIFDSRIDLEIHEKMYHPNNLNSWKPQRCPKLNCNKAFRSTTRLNIHIEEHIATKQHKCNKCLEEFSSSMKLICHQKALDKCLRTRGWTSKRWSKRIL